MESMQDQPAALLACRPVTSLLTPAWSPAAALAVPGGAGGVTFELQHAHGIRCTLVDPRPLKLNKQQLRQLQAAGRVAAIHTASAAQLQMGAEGTLLAGALDQAPAGQPGTTAAPEDDAAAVADTFHQVIAAAAAPAFEHWQHSSIMCCGPWEAVL